MRLHFGIGSGMNLGNFFRDDECRWRKEPLRLRLRLRFLPLEERPGLTILLMEAFFLALETSSLLRILNKRIGFSSLLNLPENLIVFPPHNQNQLRSPW